MLSQLEKALNLAKKTGDRLIVFDELRTDRALVVMGLDEYEKLVEKAPQEPNLTEDDLLDKINRNIAAWNSGSTEDHSEMTAADFFSAENRKKEGNNPKKYTENYQEETKRGGGPWSIPAEIKEGAEEIIEEDRQYLEEVPF